MRRRGAWLGAFLGIWFVCASAGAEPPPPPPLVLVFHESGADLPKEEIRAALERQLGRPVQTEVNPDLGEVTVGRSIDGEVIVRYRPPRAELERRLPAPETPEELAEMVSLAAQNLILNQAKDVVREIEKAPPAPVKPPSAARPPPKRAAPAAPVPTVKPRERKRHRFGLLVGVDYVYLPRSNAVCSVEGRDSEYHCYDGETPIDVDRSEAASIAPGVERGAGVFVFSQEHHLSEHVWYGWDLGVAFVNMPMRSLTGRVGMSLGYTFGTPEQLLQPKIFAGFSVGEIGAHVETQVRNEAQQVVDAWGRFGSYLAVVGAGVTYLPRVAGLDGLGLEFELPLTLAFPTTSVAVTPTFGLVFAF